MSPTVTIIISAVISICISKMMAERYLDLTLDQIDKMLKKSEETTKESVRLMMEMLNKR